MFDLQFPFRLDSMGKGAYKSGFGGMGGALRDIDDDNSDREQDEYFG